MEKPVIDGGFHGQGPDGNVSHTSEVGVEAPVYNGIFWLDLISEDLNAEGECAVSSS